MASIMLLQILTACPAPGAAGVEDVLAHRLQDRLAAGECFLRAADHEGQGAVLGARRAARNRGIQHREAGGFSGGGDGAGAVHVDGGAVDQQRLSAAVTSIRPPWCR